MALAGQGKTKATVATLEFPATCNQSLAAMVPDETHLHYRYLFYYLDSQYANVRGLVGDLRDGLSLTHLAGIWVPLPALPTQKAIGDYLDEKTAAIDALIEKKRKLLDLLAEERAALINHAVTKGLDPTVPMKDSGIPWIGEVPAHWEVRRLKTLLTFTTSGSRGWADYYSDDDGAPIFLQSGNLGKHLDLDLATTQRVNPPRGSEGERTLIETGDVLVCITGARTGAVALVDAPLPVAAYINQHVALLRLNQKLAASLFVALALSSDLGSTHFQMVQYGGTKQGLGLDDVRNVWIATPPSSEQQSISRIVDENLKQCRAAAGKIQSQIDRLQEYRQALITAAVTGQLDIEAAA
jgi:type I restriction enzyme S subunit